jgi:hypothetical protein
MKPGIMMALIACLAMVSWAAWYRLSSTPSVAAALAAVDTPAQSQDYYDELLAKVMNTASSTRATAAEPLTATDLISRQLVSDYISLAQKGQVTSDSLEALSSQYAGSLAELTQADRITLQDVKVVEDTPVAIQEYMEAIAVIYQQSAAALSGNTEEAISTSLAKKDYTFFTKINEAYTKQANALKTLSVPASFIEAHIDLVNANLLKVAAFTALAKIDDDSAMALAGVVTLSQTAEAETQVLGQMIEIIKKRQR